jgi:hypothetical protein
MLRVLSTGFLITHGLVHPAVRATPEDPAGPDLNDLEEGGSHDDDHRDHQGGLAVRLPPLR